MSDEATLADPEEELKARMIVRQLERRRRPKNQTEMLEQMDAPSVARLVDIGFVDTTPMTFTRDGWRWMKAKGDRKMSILRIAILRFERSRAAAQAQTAPGASAPALRVPEGEHAE